MNRLHFSSRMLLAAAALLFGAFAHGADYYVDGNGGDDQGSGAADNPWRTLSHAINQASGSDVIHVRAATYTESLSLAPVMKRGVSLIGVADGDQLPVISSADPGTDTLRLTNHTGVIEGLAITGATNAIGINCTTVSGGTNSATIRGNRIHGNNVGVHVTTESSAESGTPTIQGNEIYDNGSRGIGNMMYSAATISANRIHSNGGGEADNGGIGNSENSAAVIFNNLIYANDPAGVGVRDAAAPRILNNTISGHRVDGGMGAAVRVSQGQGIDTLEVVNNILAHNDYGLLSEGGAAVSGNDYNLVWDNASGDYFGFTAGTDGLAGDPLFADASAYDYRLGAGSPAIDSALTQTLVTDDFMGTLRPQGSDPDRGALEYFEGSVLAAPVLSVTLNGTTVSGEWNAVEYAEGYTLYYAPPDVSFIGERELGSQRSISVTLPPGVSYYVAVKAYNATTRSGYSNIERFTIPAP